MALLSNIYKTALSGRSLLYEKGIKKTKKLPAKVISIGNITLGGTGKTPAVIAVAQEAKNRGHKPCILTRGYKGKTRRPCFAGSESRQLLSAYYAGDEAVVMAERLEDIPVVKGRNRFLAGMYALGERGIDSINLFILDDGFQHWALHRDVDIVLIDASNPFGNGKLFPEGILREPPESLRRADIIVITKTDMVHEDSITATTFRIKQLNTRALVCTASHKPTVLINAKGGIANLEVLRNRQIYAFAGVANPTYFKKILTAQGADVRKFRTYRDHYSYTRRTISKIVNEAESLDMITTEKDLVKLKEFNLPENIYALRIVFSIDTIFYDRIFKMLLKEN